MLRVDPKCTFPKKVHGHANDMDIIIILILTTIPQCVRISNHHIIDFKYSVAASAAKSFQSCPTLCNPIDGSQNYDNTFTGDLENTEQSYI